MEREKITRELGSLKGPVLVFGGVYSNLQALEKMQSIARELGIPPGNVLCTGDVVAYCAQPEECVQLIKEWGIPTLAGNVEIQLREGLADCGCDFRNGSRCDTFSRQWYPFAQGQLSQGSLDWMEGLPDFLSFSYSGQKGFAVHGSCFETAEYIFASSPEAVKLRNFEASGADFIFAGHCGLPFSQQLAVKCWLNPGVIGMPANDGTPRVWFMVLDDSTPGKLTYSHHSFTFDHSKTAQLMTQLNLPAEYATTLSTGLWDNTEILPEAETRLSGQRLELG